MTKHMWGESSQHSWQACHVCLGPPTACLAPPQPAEENLRGVGLDRDYCGRAQDFMSAAGFLLFACTMGDTLFFLINVACDLACKDMLRPTSEVQAWSSSSYWVVLQLFFSNATCLQGNCLTLTLLATTPNTAKPFFELATEE